ncbi:hypothetical protein E4634_17410 [Mangrovimicrobium sediminis]|uniref:Glycosyltransferase family 1 protein n=1 Tax=Mangrovimicrobium sediminis TaxID=2562682 RepID=A0A4Z0LXL2_9GAMM|nr:glycosyltransferase [Haliea sp. SAOS-164]TGD71888.1 hypothetical protein E4634_17410 [Haliea sp. SAOS-164]
MVISQASQSTPGNCYLSPHLKPGNGYIDQHIKVMENLGFRIKPLASLGQDFLKRSIPPGSIIDVHWMEEWPISKSRNSISVTGLFKFCVMLLLFRLSGVPLVWQRHNYIGHDATGIGQKISRWAISSLEKIATYKLAHFESRSLVPNYQYSPHPIYTDKLVSDRWTEGSPRFVCFGAVKRYKRIPELLSIWPKETPLQIVGRCRDETLEEEINSIINLRHLDVQCDFRFVSDQEIPDLMSASDVLVLTHGEGSAVVSGAYYMAKSYGCIILAQSSEFIDSMAKTTRGVYAFNSPENLRENIERVNAFRNQNSREDIFQESCEQYSIDACALRYKDIFSMST